LANSLPLLPCPVGLHWLPEDFEMILADVESVSGVASPFPIDHRGDLACASSVL